ncbi:MAG: DUF4411 family protein [Candidatus Marinimicrobia bacterium]|nr:DUF4411 family protein [Candidatus Neomarinimicrobiota bacterium]
MQYLLDANVLIDANRDYYPLDRIPEFWEWLIHQGNEGNIKVPVEIYEEIIQGKDDLVDWLKDADVKTALLLDEDVDIRLVRLATNSGYATDLTDNEIEKLGRDPFLIAHALSDKPNRYVVTTEVSKPGKQRGNKHIPDVCSAVGVPSCHTYELLRILNFTTSWKG